jgi:hypothetical protein
LAKSGYLRARVWEKSFAKGIFAKQKKKSERMWNPLRPWAYGGKTLAAAGVLPCGVSRTRYYGLRSLIALLGV